MVLKFTSYVLELICQQLGNLLFPSRLLCIEGPMWMRQRGGRKWSIHNYTNGLFVEQ